jgi:hypothetical protein
MFIKSSASEPLPEINWRGRTACLHFGAVDERQKLASFRKKSAVARFGEDAAPRMSADAQHSLLARAMPGPPWG